MAFKQTSQPAKDNGPVKQFRAGALSVAIFKREHDGNIFYNATPSRAFTKDDGNTWEYTDSFGRDDLPVIALLMQQAFVWICSQPQK